MKRFIYVCLMILVLGFGVLDAMGEDQNAQSPIGQQELVLTQGSANGLQVLVLFYRDFALGNGVFDDALANLGITPTFTNNAATFAALIGSYAWDCIIAMHQASAGGQPFDSPLANYVAAGGRAILADWRRDATLGAAFEGSYTGANDQSPIFTDGHPVWVGLPGTINLSNPGWLIWSMGLAPIGGGVATGTFPNGNAVVIEGNSGRTLLNGMLDDTFATFSEGVTFAENEIKYICGGGPDLIISNLIAKIRTYGTPMIRGVFVNYTVTNQGNGNSNASCLDFYLSRDTVLDGGDVYVGTANIPALGAGGSYSNVKGYTLPPSKWQQASGTWRVIGVADACDDNDESDETNNQLAVVAGIVVK